MGARHSEALVDAGERTAAWPLPKLRAVFERSRGEAARALSLGTPRATAALRLHGRAGNAAVAAKHAAVAGSGSQALAAAFADMEEDACIGRHALRARVPTVRTGEGALEQWRGAHCDFTVAGYPAAVTASASCRDVTFQGRTPPRRVLLPDRLLPRSRRYALQRLADRDRAEHSSCPAHRAPPVSSRRRALRRDDEQHRDRQPLRPANAHTRSETGSTLSRIPASTRMRCAGACAMAAWCRRHPARTALRAGTDGRTRRRTQPPPADEHG